MFDVYVVGADSPGEEGLDQLCEAMCARYGVRHEDLRGRLSRGRFRIKANVDRATADTYARDLQEIGAKVSVEPAVGGTSIPPPIAVPTPAGGAGGRATTPPAIARTTTPPAGTYQSGLSAAFSAPDHPVADLGALGGSSADPLRLASLDGHDNADLQKTPDAPFTPPIADAKRPRPRDVPVTLDPFRPPDAEEAERPMEIAADELEHRARKRVSTPPASFSTTAPLAAGTPVPGAPPHGAPAHDAIAQVAPVASPPLRQSRPSIPALRPHEARQTPVSVAVVRPPGRLGPLSDERVRLAAGVVLAILIGFLPAHVISSIREHAAYPAIDALVVQHQQDATSQDEYDALDAFRKTELDAKRDAHRSIALTGLAIWALVGGAVAFGWFKAVPWDRLDSPRVG